MLLIGVQLFLLLAASTGWGWLIVLALRRKSALSTAASILYLAAGFIVQLLLLLNLAYLDVPVRTSFPLALLPGLCGLGLLWRDRTSITTVRRARFELRALAVVLALTAGIQGFALFTSGPSNYVGAGYIDQVNYVFQAQFLLERPYSTPYLPESVKLEPWLMKGLQSKDQRLGQTIALAYTAALTGRDAQETYGASVLFFLLLLAASAYGACRVSGVRPWLAAVGGAWTALCPATSEIHVYGFLSQTSSLFVFPSLFVLARTALNSREMVILPALFLSFLGVSYTEFFPFGVVAFVLLSIAKGIQGLFIRLRGVTLALCLAMILVPAYLPKGLRFFEIQSQFALSRNPALEEWSPQAGTFFGWAATMTGYSETISGPGKMLVVLVGAVLVAMIFISIITDSRRTGLRLVAIAAGPVMVGGWMLMQPAFTKYAFYKLTNQFAFLYIFLATVGAARLIRVFEQRKWKICVAGVALFLILGLSLGLSGTAGFQRRMLSPASPYTTLTKLRTPEIQKSISYIQHNPEQTYVIREKNAVVAAWLAYHARDSKTYLDVDILSDMVLTPRGQWLPLVPYSERNLNYVSSDGLFNEMSGNQLPLMQIENPQGEEHDATNTWYWVGKSIKINLLHWAMREPNIPVVMDFRATTGPAHPSNERKILISNSSKSIQQYFSYSSIQNLSVCLPMTPGLNEFTLTVVEPAEPTFVGGADPRVLMARIDSIRLRRGENAADCAAPRK